MMGLRRSLWVGVGLAVSGLASACGADAARQGDATSATDTGAEVGAETSAETIAEVAPETVTTTEVVEEIIEDVGVETTTEVVDDVATETGPDTTPETSAETTTEVVDETTTEVVADTVEDGADGADADDAANPELPPFTYPTTCDVGQGKAVPVALSLVDAFPELPNFSAPIDLTAPNDGSGRIFVVERSGVLKVIVNDPFEGRSVATYLDIHTKVATDGECGFLGIAFHPDFATNGRLFLSYCTTDNQGNLTSILSRFEVADPAAATGSGGVETELIRVTQPYSNHDGGQVRFGPDGLLYWGLGDGGSSNDPSGNGQKTSTLLGKMLRIDVDHEADGHAYAIPAGNPFANDVGSARKEICAIGMRNPWRFSFDRDAGDLWVGDVGQDAWEEVDKVVCGNNYGWKVMEGTHCRPVNGVEPNCDKTGLALPEFDYPHSGGAGLRGNTLTGGYVYRGHSAPSLVGRYVFADYGGGWVAAYTPGGAAPTSTLLSAPSIAAFGEDAEGELYALNIASGRIRMFSETGGGPVAAPAKLSQTGCFASLAPLTPAAGLLPYDLVRPFWSDGAQKGRFVVLPNGGKVTFQADGGWTFPDGSVFVKHFVMPSASGGPDLDLETRFIIKDAFGTRGFSYQWNQAGTDADLVLAGTTFPLTATDGTAFTYAIPSAAQCTTCHRDALNDGVLGLETRQLRRGAHYTGTDGAGGTFDQIDAWQRWGLFDGALPAVDTWAPALPAPIDPNIDVLPDAEGQAKAWMHVNCAVCHRPNGPSGTPMDFRMGTPLAAMQICGVAPLHGTQGVADAKLLAPGAADHSIVYLRMIAPNRPPRMPPLGPQRIDPEGAALVEDWIGGLSACPTP